MVQKHLHPYPFPPAPGLKGERRRKEEGAEKETPLLCESKTIPLYHRKPHSFVVSDY